VPEARPTRPGSRTTISGPSGTTARGPEALSPHRHVLQRCHVLQQRHGLQRRHMSPMPPRRPHVYATCRARNDLPGRDIRARNLEIGARARPAGCAKALQRPKAWQCDDVP